MKFPPIPKDAAKDFTGKVVIIGAGVSGLFAANTLKFMGVEDYVVLEASDRFGGRLKSVDSFHDEVPLDMGAEWIHSSNEQIVKDMLLFDHDEGLNPAEFIKYQPDMHFRSKKKSILSYIYQETKWKRSTWWHWLEKYVYRHVMEKVKLNSPVEEIIYNESDEKVKLVMASGEVLHADKIICTVPLAVLKKDTAVKFEPPLPEKKRKAIDAIQMPPGFRVIFEMKEKFYPDITVDNTFLGQLFDFDDLAAIYDPLLGKELSANKNLLTYVAIGDKHAGELSALDNEELAKATLAKVDKMFDGQGSKNYVKHTVQNWTKEPYILGSYSFSCAKHHRIELGKTVDDKVLFAGEHTSLSYHSLVPGAALEGRRAAVEAVSGRII